MYFGLIFTGLLAGILSGFFGIGGGVIIIPILAGLFGFSQLTAQGTTLAAMIPPIGLLAAIAYWKAGHIDIKAAIFIALGFLIGGFIGGTFVQKIEEPTVRKAFAVMLLLVAIKMWFNK